MKPQACKNTSTDSPFFKNKYFLHHTENFWFFYKFKIHCIRKLSIRHMNVASCSNPAKTWMWLLVLSLLSFTFVFLLLFSQIIFVVFPPSIYVSFLWITLQFVLRGEHLQEENIHLLILLRWCTMGSSPKNVLNNNIIQSY